MKAILSKNAYLILVDDEDYDSLSEFEWVVYAQTPKHLYARTNKTLMHREVAKTPKGMDTDHINHNTLDNEKRNLRISTRSQNKANTARYKNNTSGFKGIEKHRNRWRLNYMARKEIGNASFVDKKDAARLYDKWATLRFGEYAVTNKSLGLL